MKFLEISAALASVAAATPAYHSHGRVERSEVKARVPDNWSPKFPPLPRLPHTIRPSPGPSSKPLVRSDKLQASIKSKALLDHAENLQAIAYATTDRNRVFGSPGHNFTALYLHQLIKQLDEYYTVEYQPFVELFSDGSASLDVQGDRGGALMTYSPSGHVESAIVPVSNLGCEATDFPAEVSGKIALIKRGSCEFGLKSAYAGAAGAAGAIIYNNINGSLSGTLGSPNRPQGAYPPTLSISLEDGTAILNLIAAGETTGILDVESIIENRTTINVIAQTKGGDQNNVLVVGGHADSVAAGPGINDDGSGSIGILEVALNLAKYKINNAVRFIWWSAEEYGLLGSEHYVTTLPAEELDKIRLYLNFDMIASPNYIYGIYDGDGSAFNLSGPAGSGEAEKLFEDFYRSKKLHSQPTEFSGRSDYGPFLDAGIAAGGLFTGAEVLKTAEEAIWYGGDAGVAYDVNYHLVGDTVDNLNVDAFVTNTKAIAHAVATYAKSFDSLPPKTKRVKRSVPVTSKRSGCHHEHEEVLAL